MNDEHIAASDPNWKPLTPVEQIELTIKRMGEEAIERARAYDTEVQSLQDRALDYCKRMEASAADNARLMRELAQAHDAVDGYGAAMKERDALKHILKRLETALGFYCDPLNWENEFVDIGVGGQPIPFSSAAAQDMGQRARAVVEEYIALRQDYTASNRQLEAAAGAGELGRRAIEWCADEINIIEIDYPDNRRMCSCCENTARIGKQVLHADACLHVLCRDHLAAVAHRAAGGGGAG